MLHKEENYKCNMLEKAREEGLRIQMEDCRERGVLTTITGRNP